MSQVKNKCPVNSTSASRLAFEDFSVLGFQSPSKSSFPNFLQSLILARSTLLGNNSSQFFSSKTTNQWNSLMNLLNRTCLAQTWSIPGALGCCNLGRLWRHSNQQAEKTEVGREDNSSDHISMWLSEVPRHFVQEQWCYPQKPEHVPS